jgi:hypothetical protein
VQDNEENQGPEIPDELPDELPDEVPQGTGDVDLSGVTQLVSEDCPYVEERSLGDNRFLVMFYRYRAEDGEEAPNAISDEMVAKVRSGISLSSDCCVHAADSTRECT